MTTASPAGPGSADPSPAPVELIRRWEEFGGLWRIVARDGVRATVSLCTCDGGEEMHRLVSDDPGLLRFLDEQGPVARNGRLPEGKRSESG